MRPTDDRTPAGRGGRPGWWRTGRWVLLVTALAQAVSPALAGFDQGSSADPVIVPPGPFFGVWGLVLVGCLAVAVRGLAAQRAAGPVFTRLHVALSLVQVGFVAWLVLAATEPVATVPVFAAMLVGLALALRAAPHAVVAPATTAESAAGTAAQADHRLVDAVLGTYAGWTAAAVWVNTATVLPDPSPGVLGALLVGAVLTELALLTLVTRTTAARLAAGLTGGWALVGVSLSTGGAGAAPLLVLAVGGCAAVLVTAVATAVATRHRRTAPA